MRPGTPGFVGARLAEARAARGLTGVAFAELLGVRPQSITYYEQDKTSPHPDVMEKISSQLNLPVSYFMRPAFLGDDANIFWRSNTSATKSARTRAEIRLVWLKETMAYLRQFFDFPTPHLPRFSLPADFHAISGEHIEELAAECRRYWGLGDGPMPDVIAELESNGIVLSRIHVGVDNLDAFSQWSKYDDTPYTVLGVDKASAVRCRFDAAHELAHLLLHQNVERKRINSPADFKIIEDQAHRFASAFLMPAATFTKEVWTASLDTFKAVKPRWGASIAAMIMRCRYLGIITDDQERRLWINMNRRGWRKEEPFDDKIKAEKPRLIGRAIEMLIEEQVRGTEQILLDLHLSPSDLEEISGLEHGFLRKQSAEVMPFPRLKDRIREVVEPTEEDSVVIRLDTLRRND